jgi:hypothetical protein
MRPIARRRRCPLDRSIRSPKWHLPVVGWPSGWSWPPGRKRGRLSLRSRHLAPGYFPRREYHTTTICGNGRRSTVAIGQIARPCFRRRMGLWWGSKGALQWTERCFSQPPTLAAPPNEIAVRASPVPGKCIDSCPGLPGQTVLKRGSCTCGSLRATEAAPI